MNTLIKKDFGINNGEGVEVEDLTLLIGDENYEIKKENDIIKNLLGESKADEYCCDEDLGYREIESAVIENFEEEFGVKILNKEEYTQENASKKVIIKSKEELFEEYLESLSIDIKNGFKKLKLLKKSFSNPEKCEEILYVFDKLKQIIIEQGNGNKKLENGYGRLLGSFLANSNNGLHEALSFDISAGLYNYDIQNSNTLECESTFIEENVCIKNFNIPIDRLKYLNSQLDSGIRISLRLREEILTLNRKILEIMMFFDVYKSENDFLIDETSEFFDVKSLTAEMSISNEVVIKTIKLLNKTINEKIKSKT